MQQIEKKTNRINLLFTAETIAFHAVLAPILVNISFGDPVIFDNVLLNEGTR